MSFPIGGFAPGEVSALEQRRQEWARQVPASRNQQGMNMKMTGTNSHELLDKDSHNLSYKIYKLIYDHG